MVGNYIIIDSSFEGKKDSLRSKENDENWLGSKICLNWSTSIKLLENKLVKKCLERETDIFFKTFTALMRF